MAVPQNTFARLDIRPAVRDDLPALMSFSDRFNRPGSSTFRPDFFAWQFAAASVAAGRPEEGGAITAAFAPDGRVMGYCAGNHLRAQWQGRLVPGVSLHEWYVDPEASGVGIRLLGEVMRGSDFVGVSGASVNTMNVFLRLHRSVTWLEMTRLVAVLDPETCFRLMPDGLDQRSLDILRMLRPAMDGDADVMPIERFGIETDRLWQRMAPDCLLAADRDAQALNWRYADHPMFRYERVVVRSAAGDALFVWRMEIVQGIDWGECRVARLCEAIGDRAAITAALPGLMRHLSAAGAALCDFFCTHAETLDALAAGGMSPCVTTPYVDLPRLFAPLHRDMRRTINMACFVRSASPAELRRPSRFLFTKADSSQDRPNP